MERRRHRTYSPDYYETRHRSYVRSIPQYRNSSPEPYDSSHSEVNSSSSISRKQKSLFQRKRHRNKTCQITMTYRRQDHERHGDEILVLQDNIIVFKGFLQPEGEFEKQNICEKEFVCLFEESFTFQFQRHHRQSNVNLEFLINELFQCSLTINCEEQQIEQENRLFQLVNFQSRDSNRRYFFSSMISIVFIFIVC